MLGTYSCDYVFQEPNYEHHDCHDTLKEETVSSWKPEDSTDTQDLTSRRPPPPSPGIPTLPSTKPTSRRPRTTLGASTPFKVNPVHRLLWILPVTFPEKHLRCLGQLCCHPYQQQLPPLTSRNRQEHNTDHYTTHLMPSQYSTGPRIS